LGGTACTYQQIMIKEDAVLRWASRVITFPEEKRLVAIKPGRGDADPTRMGQGSLNFVVWWYAVLAVLGIAAWFTMRSRVEIDWESTGLVFLVGVGAGLAMYMAPSGLGSMHSMQDVQLRFFGALAISWLAAIRMLPAGAGPGSYSTLALAGFAGVNAPLLAFVASAFMVCGGQPSCVA
jgi:hypothetical protein